MTLREQIEEQNRQWRLFHEWEQAQPPAERDPARLIEDVGGLLRWFDRSTIAHDPDPDKIGISKMRAALAMLEHD